jgi:hypothetical protein
MKLSAKPFATCKIKKGRVFDPAFFFALREQISDLANI